MVNYIVNSFHYQQSSGCKGVADSSENCSYSLSGITSHINLLTQLFLQKLQNAHRMQCGRLYVLRTVGLEALPLVGHLVGITHGSHPMHKAFIEHGSKPFSRLHVIYLHLHCWHDKHKFLLQPSCVCHGLQGEEENPLQDAANSFLDIMAFPHSSPEIAYGTFLFCLEQILMHNLPLDLQSVGYFLLPQVQLGNKRFSALVQPNSARYFS